MAGRGLAAAALFYTQGNPPAPIAMSEELRLVQGAMQGWITQQQNKHVLNWLCYILPLISVI